MRRLKRIWYLLNLPCEHATEIMSYELDGKPPWDERWAMRAHLIACRMCRRYRRHLRVVRAAMDRLAERMLAAPPTATADLKLSDAARRRILEELRQR
jgi:anti-sigma factor RsiW